MASEHWPTYVLLSLYLIGMISVTIVANRKNRSSETHNQTKQESSIHTVNESNQSLSIVTTHFLASKTFGPIILLLTTFASVFSGYTVVGVPNEAGTNGFIAIRWITAALFVALSLLMIFPRIRRISVVRNYSSPGDFINDRFGQNKILCCLVTLCLCVPQLLYLAVNIYSLGALLEFLTDEELPYYWITIICVILTILFEALGGMRSVAYTDTIEAAVMCFVFVAIPTVIAIDYGGFIGQVSLLCLHVLCQRLSR